MPVGKPILPKELVVLQQAATIEEANENLEALSAFIALNLRNVRRKKDPHFIDKSNVVRDSKSDSAKELAKKKFNSRFFSINEKDKKDIFKSLRRFQRKWREERSMDRLLEIDPKQFQGILSDEFARLINNKKVTLNLNKSLRDDILRCIATGDFSDINLTDEKTIAATLALYMHQYITKEALEDVLGIAEAMQSLPALGLPINEVKTYRLLDEAGQFTENAINIVIKNMKNSYYMNQDISPEVLESFRLMLAAYFVNHPEGNLFYTSKLDRKEYEYDELANELHFYTKSLLFNVTDDSIQRVHLSTATEQLLRLVCFGKDMAVNVRVLGKTSVNDVQVDVSEQMRPTLTIVPGHTNVNTDVHEIPMDQLAATTASTHDLFHGQDLSKTPNIIKAVFLNCNEIFFQAVLKDMHRISSPEVWHAIDEFRGYRKKSGGADPFSDNDDDSRHMAEIFSDSINVAAPNASFFFDKEEQPTAYGIINFIHMARHADTFWAQIPFNPEEMTGEAKDCYDQIKELLSLLSDDPMLNTIICTEYYNDKSGHPNKLLNFETNKLPNIIKIYQDNKAEIKWEVLKQDKTTLNFNSYYHK